MMLCALKNGTGDDWMADIDNDVDILVGYTNDPWFAEEVNISKEDLCLENGAYLLDILSKPRVAFSTCTPSSCTV